MQGSWQLPGLIEGGSGAPVEPRTGSTEAWQTGQFPPCAHFSTMNTTTPDHNGNDSLQLSEGHKGTNERLEEEDQSCKTRLNSGLSA